MECIDLGNKYRVQMVLSLCQKPKSVMVIKYCSLNVIRLTSLITPLSRIIHKFIF